MKEQEKNQHAMTTFALLGGLFLAPRPKSQGKAGLSNETGLFLLHICH